MRIKVDRLFLTDRSTIGKLYVNDVFECYTLEDKVRPQKIKGVTAIPSGIYKLIVTWSPRFKRQLPLLQDVHGFEGVRIHPGNKPEDTEGCLLVGTSIDPAIKDVIYNSKVAFERLYEKLITAIDHHEEITIEIKDKHE